MGSVVPECGINILLCLSRQNILELTVCDEDTFTPDDQLLTVRFDVAKIQPGKRVHLNFELNPEVRNEKTSEIKTIDKIIFFIGILSQVTSFIKY